MIQSDLEAELHKSPHPAKARHTRRRLASLFAGALSFTILLFSAYSVIAAITHTHASNTIQESSANVAVDRAFHPNDTSTVSPTPTSSPSPTATNTPSPTATSTPSPTATSSPSPTVTNTPSPSPTAAHTPTSTPSPASSPSPTATSTSPSPTPSPTVLASMTPGSTATATAGQTPTTASPTAPITSNDNVNQPTAQGQQDGGFPITLVLYLLIGLLSAGVLALLLTLGWMILRRRLLPMPPAKLPPSGVGRWTRTRPADANWTTNGNGWGHAQDWATTGAAPTAATAPFTSWQDSSAHPSHLNDPYLQEMITQYSQRGQTANWQNDIDQIHQA